MSCLHKWTKEHPSHCSECQIGLAQWIRERNKDVPKSKGNMISDGLLFFADGEIVRLKKNNWPKVGDDLEEWRRR